MNFRLPKSERLHSVKSIEELFSEGSSFFLYPFKVIFRKAESLEKKEGTSVLFSVPKKRLKKAHQRNQVKRRMREAYRLNKHTLTGSSPTFLGFVYVSHEILDFAELQAKMVKALSRLNIESEKTTEDEKPSK